MKIMKRQFFVLFLAVAIVSGCQDDPATDPQPTQSGKLVDKIIRTADGQSTVFSLTYDAKNRLTGYEDSGNSENFNLAYDASGNLNKVEIKEDEGKTSFEITYNAAGEPVSGVYRIFEADQLVTSFLLTYSVANGRVNEIFLKDPASQLAYGKFVFSYTNGNLTKVETIALGQAPITQTYTHGTNKNVFFGSRIKYVVDPVFSALFYSSNEVLTEKVARGQMTTEIDNQYTYDADGYPTAATIRSKSSASAVETVSNLKIEYK